MNREDFTIYPLQGFGRLKFGQSVAEAKNLAELYGKIEADGPMFDEERWLEWREELRQNPYLTEEMVIEMTEGYKESRKYGYLFTFNGNIILFFDEDRLHEIRLSKSDFPAYLGEQDLFALYGEPAVHHVAHHLSENPYMWEKAMFFVNHSLVIGNYYSDIQGNNIIWTAPNTRYDKRNIFLNTLEGEYGFDPNDTPIYKIIP